MWGPITICLRIALGLLLAEPVAVSAASAQRLSYVVSYQGLFSAGLSLEIAKAYLAFGPSVDAATGSSFHVALQVSTHGYEAAELLYPVRFCYRSYLDNHEGATRQSDWWSRTGSKVSLGRLSFDRARRRVLRLEAKRTLAGDAVGKLDEFTKTSVRAAPAMKQEREEAPFSPGVVPMDRLAMVWWLRQQPLELGAVLRPAVSDGSRLLGYRIEVEGVEAVPWMGGTRHSYRLRLEPLFSDGSEVHSSRLWLSRDHERLPLLLRGSRGFGSFEMRLLSDHSVEAPGCEIPEHSGLVLPSP